MVNFFFLVKVGVRDFGVEKCFFGSPFSASLHEELPLKLEIADFLACREFGISF
jgi:hypothetical protein